MVGLKLDATLLWQHALYSPPKAFTASSRVSATSNTSVSFVMTKMLLMFLLMLQSLTCPLLFENVVCAETRTPIAVLFR